MSRIDSPEHPQTGDFQPMAGKFTGKHMALCMVGFFGVIIAVNLLMATLAKQSWTGLVVKNSYVASQDFNDHLQAGRDQAALGWKSIFLYTDGQFSFDLQDRDGASVKADHVDLEIGRPATEISDATLSMSLLVDGQFQLQHRLAPGLWDVRAKARVGEKTYIRDLRLHVGRQGASETGATKPAEPQ